RSKTPVALPGLVRLGEPVPRFLTNVRLTVPTVRNPVLVASKTARSAGFRMPRRSMTLDPAIRLSAARPNPMATRRYVTIPRPADTAAPSADSRRNHCNSGLHWLERDLGHVSRTRRRTPGTTPNSWGAAGASRISYGICHHCRRGVPVSELPTGGTVRPITRWGTPVMHRELRTVTEFDDELATLVADMFATMYAADGAGLAANQIGVDLKVFVFDCTDGNDNRVKGAVCNPVLILPDAGDRRLDDDEEGC